jgi:hypothetical protein
MGQNIAMIQFRRSKRMQQRGISFWSSATALSAFRKTNQEEVVSPAYLWSFELFPPSSTQSQPLRRRHCALLNTDTTSESLRHHALSLRHPTRSPSCPARLRQRLLGLAQLHGLGSFGLESRQQRSCRTGHHTRHRIKSWHQVPDRTWTHRGTEPLCV